MAQRLMGANSQLPRLLLFVYVSWPSMIGWVVMFTKCLCLKGMNKVAVLTHCWVSGAGSALKLKICLVRLFPSKLATLVFIRLLE